MKRAGGSLPPLAISGLSSRAGAGEGAGERRREEARGGADQPGPGSGAGARKAESLGAGATGLRGGARQDECQNDVGALA